VAMPALQFDHDQPVVDPDQLKMPETATHRRAVDLIGLAATGLLGSGDRMFRDMNWYPVDGGGPMAPDLMVLPAGAIEPNPTSYRQDRTDGPPPTVVVEVPSESDTFVSFRAKAFRYRALGTVAYLVVTASPHQAVLRLGPDHSEPQPWADRPIAELGDLRLGFHDGELVATTPAGIRASSDADLLAEADGRATEADGRATEAEGRATEAERRASEAEGRAADLARRLEALGVGPDEGANTTSS
jgi:hypothetical protein